MEEKHICEYGCEKEATHQFKNGKWCCENNWSKCSNQIIFRKYKLIGNYFCEKCNKEYKRKSDVSQHIKKCNGKKFCLYCKKELFNKNKFCNSRCAAFYNNENSKKLKNYHRGPYSSTGFCLNCNVKKRGIIKYCCGSCKIEYEYKQNISLWKSGKADITRLKSYMKKYLLEKYENKCSICGWNQKHSLTGKSPLHLHHKDGNWKNNSEENLTILCPNCHSLTENFGSKNKGKGKVFMRDYYKIYSYLKNHKDVYQDLINQKRNSLI
jgi:hypothetical protein